MEGKQKNREMRSATGKMGNDFRAMNSVEFQCKETVESTKLEEKKSNCKIILKNRP